MFEGLNYLFLGEKNTVPLKRERERSTIVVTTYVVFGQQRWRLDDPQRGIDPIGHLVKIQNAVH